MAKRGPKPKIGTMRPVDGPVPDNDLIYRETGDELGAVNPPDAKNPEKTFEPKPLKVAGFLDILIVAGNNLEDETKGLPNQEQYQLAMNYIENARTAYRNGNLANGR